MEYNSIFEKYENSMCLGLENGRCGLTLLAFLLSEKDGEYRNKALTHLDYLVEHVYESSSLSFNEGLLGIGWTLEFLTQNSYIPVAYEDLLSEIDDIIYKWINFHGIKTISLNNGYLGCLLFLCYRLKGGRISTPYKELSLKECTIRLLGQISNEIKMNKKTQITSTEWYQLHILVGLFRSMKIQNHISIDILSITQHKVKQYNTNLNLHNNSNLMELFYSLFAKSKKHKTLKNFFL